jgi:hypothetical protein
MKLENILQNYKEINIFLKKLDLIGSTMRQLLVDFKKAYDSVRREVFYNILIEFWVPMKL